MQKQILAHYRSFSSFTFPGAYLENIQNDLPSDIQEIGELVRASLIHRSTLASGNTGTNTESCTSSSICFLCAPSSGVSLAINGCY